MIVGGVLASPPPTVGGISPARTAVKAPQRNSTPRSPQVMRKVTRQAERGRSEIESGHAAAATPKVFVVQCDNSTDCTLPLQSALDNATADVVFVPGRASVWHTRPLQLNRSNVELRLGPGTVLQARRGFFHGADDMVLVVKSATNVSITGDGHTSAIRMWRIDYRNVSLYSKAEWRHGVGVYDTALFTISGVTIAETGGDGIYLNGVTNATVRNVTTVGAYDTFSHLFSSAFVKIALCCTYLSYWLYWCKLKPVLSTVVLCVARVCCCRRCAATGALVSGRGHSFSLLCLRARANTHALLHTHTHTRTRARAHTHTRAHTHKHTHTHSGTATACR